MLRGVTPENVHSPARARALTSRLREASFIFYDRYEGELFTGSTSSE